MRRDAKLAALLSVVIPALVLPALGALSPAAAAVAVPSGGCVRLTNGPDLTCSFAYQGATETWTVPDGVTSAVFDVYGAQGFSAYPNSDVVGGKGGRVSGALAVTPGQELTVAVGGQGFNSRNPSPGGGGFGGGGSAYRNAGGGGGATTVKDSGTFLFVAGGGGGSSLSQSGGVGGGPNGGGGQTIPRPSDSTRGEGGQGATQSAAGAGGPETPTTMCDVNADPVYIGTAGGDGVGMVGGTGGNLGSGADGGGGGGGWFGGGGGAGGSFCGSLSSGGGGGGGSSQVGSGTSNVSYEAGARSGDGLVTVTYNSPDPDGAPGVTINQAASQGDSTGTEPIHFTAVFSQPVTGFTGADVTLGGSAGGTLAASVAEVSPSDGTTYTVSVTGMTTAGSVTASVPAGVATDADFSTNEASTSADNSVDWQPDGVAPTADPTYAPAPNANGWNSSDVTVTWNWTDGDGSGVDPDNCTPTSTSIGQGSAIELKATCSDLAGNEGQASTTVKVDKTAPTASLSVSPAPNANGWNNSDVTVTWNWTDGDGSGLDLSNCTTSTDSSGEGAQITVSGACTDLAGNQGSASTTVRVDKTAPTLAPSVSPNPVILGGSATASANASDSLSGIASQSCDPASTSTIGTTSVSCSATDVAGNSSSASASYTVGAFFGGFSAPLPNSLPAKAGSRIPVKFTLTDANGTLSDAASQAMAAKGQVRVQLIGPGTSSAVVAQAGCAWNTSNSSFECSLKTPKNAQKGAANLYLITVQERGLAQSFFNVPGDGNPLSMYFK